MKFSIVTIRPIAGYAMPARGKPAAGGGLSRSEMGLFNGLPARARRRAAGWDPGLRPGLSAPIVSTMDIRLPENLETEFSHIEREINRLTHEVRRLKEENRQLANRLHAVSAERAQLLNKNAIVQNRVESMIARLKGLERAT